MDSTVEHSMNIHSRKWGVISLLETVKRLRKTQPRLQSELKTPKRVKTDFFPNRNKGRKSYKERSYFLLSPEDPLKVLWNIIKTFCIIVESFLIPYSLTFSPKDIKSCQIGIEILEVFFFCDIFFKFNTEVYKNGVLISKRIFIAKHYLRGFFFFDLLAVFPFQLLMPEANLDSEYLYISASNSQALKFLWILKLLRLFESKRLVYEIEDYFVSSVFLGPIRTFNFFFSAFIWTHWLACVLYAYFARGLEQTDLLWNRYLPEPVDNYLRSFYLIVETMTSVGYGDILPITYGQHMIAIFSMCFACVLFGNIIGNIQGFIENYGADEKYYESTARRLKAHLKDNKLPNELRHRVIQYIYYLKNMSQKNNAKELTLLESLSAPLKEEIYTQTRGYLLAKSAVFRSYCGSFLKYLGHQMKMEVLAPADQIFKEGEMSNVIYYLCSGKVQIYHEATKTVFKDIKKNKYFGEISFFLDTCRTASAMCLEFSEFLTLDRNTFFTLLHSRPREMEITNVIVHNTEKYNNLALLGIRCYLCRKMGHIAKNCVEFIYIPDQGHAAKKAESKIHMKSVNVNGFTPAISYKRQELQYDPYTHYDIFNTKGSTFTPRVKYIGNSRIITKAWSMERKKNILGVDRMRMIPEGSNESDSEELEEYIRDTLYVGNSLRGEYTMTFGENK